MKRLCLVALLLAGLGNAPRALAYGGLVTSPTEPLTLTAQRVLIADHGDGTLTAVIELRYAGEAERFGWVIPVPSAPTVALASSAAFDRLQGLTDPIYGVEGAAHGTCLDERALSSAWPQVAATLWPQASFDRGDVGPFEYEVFGADMPAGDALDALEAWLDDGGVDPTNLDRDVLADYLADGQRLLSLRLGAAQDPGAIRPIAVTYEGERVVLPLIATASSAGEEVSLQVWLLGPARGVPLNYVSVELNETRLDWFDPVASYHPLVSEAIDEAGGQGFVTEHSVPTAGLADGFSLVTREQWESLTAGDPGQLLPLLDASVLVFGGWDGFEAAVRLHAPGAGELSDDELFACISCYIEDLDAFAATLSEQVVDPMLRVHDLLLATERVTRLYTRLGPDDMTLDPEFGFNPDLPEVPSGHAAIGAFTCDERFAVELPSGNFVRGEWGTWPDGSDLPAASRIVQYAESGDGEVVTDNRMRIDEAYPPPGAAAAEADAGVVGAGEPAPPRASDAGVQPNEEDSSGCGCASVGREAPPIGAPVAIAGLALCALRRKRPARRQ